jgi:phosphoglucomutase
MMAVTGRDPGELYDGLTREFGDFAYERIAAPATPDQKAVLQRLSPDQITASTIAGDRITSLLTNAPGNGAPIGGLKVVTERGWFAVRPSGTEDVYKLYTESFVGSDHLSRIQEEAQTIIRCALSVGGRN